MKQKRLNREKKVEPKTLIMHLLQHAHLVSMKVPCKIRNANVQIYILRVKIIEFYRSPTCDMFHFQALEAL